MERELAQGLPSKFDLLVVDAFSGDAPPVHLLTEQAFQVYLGEIAQNGIVAIHHKYLYQFAACGRRNCGGHESSLQVHTNKWRQQSFNLQRLGAHFEKGFTVPGDIEENVDERSQKCNRMDG